MGQLAFNIETAAHATSTTEHAIRHAIKERKLIARDLDGLKLILRVDLQEWLETLPHA